MRLVVRSATRLDRVYGVFTGTSSGARQRRRVLGAFLAILTVVAAVRTAAQERDAGPEAAIRATAKAFVAAFNQNDPQAIAALWVPNGTLADEDGTVINGGDAIAGQYSEFFKAHPGSTVQVDVTSIHFVTPEMAVEDGTARVSMGHAALPTASRYSAVHVLQGGQWLMASVRESTVEVPPSTSGLKQLDWLVGEWESTAEDTSVRAKFEWLPGEVFLKRTTTVSKDGKPWSTGLQIIGWDPQAGAPRSWSFDSTGGYGGGLWTATSEGWMIESQGVLASGEETASHELLLRVPGEAGLLGWRSVDRSVGEEPLADIPEVVFDRVQAKP